MLGRAEHLLAKFSNFMTVHEHSWPTRITMPLVHGAAIFLLFLISERMGWRSVGSVTYVPLPCSLLQLWCGHARLLIFHTPLPCCPLTILPLSFSCGVTLVTLEPYLLLVRKAGGKKSTNVN